MCRHSKLLLLPPAEGAIPLVGIALLGDSETLNETILDAGFTEEDTFTEQRVLVKFEPHSISGEGIKLGIFSPFKIMIRIQPATVTLLISR